MSELKVLTLYIIPSEVIEFSQVLPYSDPKFFVVTKPSSSRFIYTSTGESPLIAFGFSFTEQEVKEAIETYTAVEKRMQLLNRNGITIINDAYNANPVSMNAAFDTIHSMKCDSKIYFVLGDMFELGERSISLHREVLQQALKENPHEVYIMGRDMELALHFLNAEVASKIKVYNDHERLAKSLRRKLCKGDLILLKGSRGMEMEKVLSYL